MSVDYLLYVKKILRQYPDLVKEEEELRITSCTPNYSAVGHSSGISNPVEAAALRTLPPKKQRRLDAVRYAIKETQKEETGKDTLKIINLVYFKKTCTVTGAALLIPCGAATAYRYHQRFIDKMAYYLDLV